jgi:hypothetical protein
LSSWQNDLLAKELLELQGLDFNLDLTGFSGEELQRLLAPPPNEGQADADAVPEPPD